MPKALKKIADLTPDPQNVNKGTERGARVLEHSLRTLGAGRSILTDKNGLIIAGNKTLEHAAEIGLPIRTVQTDGGELIVVQRTDLDLTTDARARELAIADNRVSELSYDPDVEMLLKHASNIDLSAYYTTEELEFEIPNHPKKEPANAEPDRAEELLKKWGVEFGQIWQCETIRIMCGDSINTKHVKSLLNKNTFSTLFFDPPYDAPAEVLAHHRGCTDALVFTDHRHTFEYIDGWPPFRSAFVWDGVTSWYTPTMPLARAKFAFWFGSSPYNEDGAHYGEPGKPHTVTNTRGSYEYIPDPRGKHLSTLYQSPNTQQDDSHAHTKPVEWVRMLLANCTNGPVFDPFLGGGTSVLVAHELGRPAYGMEIDPANFAVTLERLKSSGLQPERVQ